MTFLPVLPDHQDGDDQCEDHQADHADDQREVDVGHPRTGVKFPHRSHSGESQLSLGEKAVGGVNAELTP